MYEIEIIVFIFCCYLTFRFFSKWCPFIAGSWPPERNRSSRFVLGCLPVAALVIIVYTLGVLASFDVVNNFIYIIFYIIMGYACIYVGLIAIAFFFDLSWIDDVLNLNLAKELGFPRKTYQALSRLSSYNREQNVRLMRFDFHPTTTGWAVSEVNSDVPGGLAEASVLPEIACQYFDDFRPGVHLANSLVEALKPKLTADGPMAFVHATSYADDRQVMQFLSDYCNARGVRTIFAAPDHIRWINKKAFSIVEGEEGELSAILRFFPLNGFRICLKNQTGWAIITAKPSPATTPFPSWHSPKGCP